MKRKTLINAYPRSRTEQRNYRPEISKIFERFNHIALTQQVNPRLQSGTKQKVLEKGTQRHQPAPNGDLNRRQSKQIEHDEHYSESQLSSDLSTTSDLTPLRYTSSQPPNYVAQESSSDQTDHAYPAYSSKQTHRSSLGSNQITPHRQIALRLLPTSVKTDVAKRRRIVSSSRQTDRTYVDQLLPNVEILNHFATPKSRTGPVHTVPPARAHLSRSPSLRYSNSSELFCPTTARARENIIDHRLDSLHVLGISRS
ncbi:hypothetical protein F511_38494 [Dorcoceras hygrometricum]|uniref:Uncharacterized protein n=1 Tax=Dorcoceras hygrometricum TaxID=472368 RepID=A0A2Z7BBU6_9LAMI|nr:hypothetical protein F511_38494 [Dorcoceras hygrometricum]